MIKKLSLALYILLFGISFIKAQTINRVEPPSWWVGMKNSELQLLVYGENVSKAQVNINYPGVNLVSISYVKNPNYLFINLNISPSAKPGNFQIEFKFSSKKIVKYSFNLKSREEGSAEREGFDASDVIYLLYPDRFANGDTSNDAVAWMNDHYNRGEPYARHGGDIQGIINNLDYFKQLGVTALWLNPVFENNQLSWSYHGYAITDFYKVDARLGDNDLYREFVNLAQERGIKVIKDLVFNHCGDMHWWIKDLPMPDWLNQWPEHTQSNYRQTTVFDPHASNLDHNLMSKGWFAKQMPDLNHNNPFLARYLIQNTLWWIEFANLNGFRMDTHPYGDKVFMATWCRTVLNEYPNFTIVGETWYTNPAAIAYWQKDARNYDGYNSYLPVVMDFPLMHAINKAFDEEDGWETGMARLYDVLSQDLVYFNYSNLLTFIDNHDKGRFHPDSTLELSRLKLALTFLLTTRGIPQIYYGTEIILPGHDSKGHGDIRRDFPGGWPTDSRSAFTPEGRTLLENELWNYLSKILHWRKGATAVHDGKLIHFTPEEGVYTYFRKNDHQTIMVILNNSTEPKIIKTSRFSEIMSWHKMATEIISERSFENLKEIHIDSRGALILELH